MDVESFNIIQPSTVTIKFDAGVFPKLFQVFKDDGTLYYFRHLDGKTTTININFPENGHYITDHSTPFTEVSSKPIVISGQNIPLPKPDRNYPLATVIQINKDLQGPARIFYKIGIIENSPALLDMPEAIRVFVNLHEQGHCLYSQEFDCDIYAMKNYLALGYNASMGFYAMSHVLKESSENEKRLKSMFAVMNYTGLIKKRKKN